MTWVWVRACSTAAAVQLRHTRCIQGLLHRGAVQDDILHSFKAMNSGWDPHNSHTKLGRNLMLLANI